MSPPAEFSEYRENDGPQKVTLWNGSNAWLFTRFDDVRAILSDSRFSIQPTTPGFPMLSAARDAFLKEPPTFIRMDPPDHTRLRRMITKEFMVARMDAMRPRIQKLVDDLLDEMEEAGPPFDLVNDFALPLTSTVISEMLGVPMADSEFFQEQSRLRILMDVDPEIPRKASVEIMAYLDKLVRDKEADPYGADDLLSRLVIDQVIPGHLSHDDAVRHADLLLMAGHETTANQIALGILVFLQNPDQIRLLLDKPELIRSATNEVIRHQTIVHFNSTRVAVEDVEIRGHVVKKGEGVFALLGAANRDPSIFAGPDVFDIMRKSDSHIGFSYGIHQCLGQPLARAELQIVFLSILRRFPNLQLALPMEDLEFKTNHFVYGLETLPVSW